jgi:hypothetical protein
MPDGYKILTILGAEVRDCRAASAPARGMRIMLAKLNERVTAAGQSPATAAPAAKISLRLRIAAIFLRALFVGTLLVVTARVSIPQSETIWSVWETPGDVVRLALGVAVGIWILVHLFMLPKDPEAYRMWVYLGLIVAPFVLLVAIATW